VPPLIQWFFGIIRYCPYKLTDDKQPSLAAVMEASICLVLQTEVSVELTDVLCRLAGFLFEFSATDLVDLSPT
jgi:hypothetical protein